MTHAERMKTLYPTIAASWPQKEQSMTAATKTGLALMREPFPENQISKLPKPKSKDAPKGRCPECGGWHGLPAVHLDYVGHAALTARLLDADPAWTWEPVAFDDKGLPALDANGGLWIRLTISGVTRLGYGDAQGKTGPDAMKERIGDALRNAGMRFGAALDLWHKGDLYAHTEDDNAAAKPQPAVAASFRSSPTMGALESLPAEEQTYIRDLAMELIAMLRDGNDTMAVQRIESENLDDSQKMALWSLLDSKTRAAIKKAQATMKETAAA